METFPNQVKDLLAGKIAVLVRHPAFFAAFMQRLDILRTPSLACFAAAWDQENARSKSHNEVSWITRSETGTVRHTVVGDDTRLTPYMTGSPRALAKILAMYDREFRATPFEGEIVHVCGHFVVKAGPQLWQQIHRCLQEVYWLGDNDFMTESDRYRWNLNALQRSKRWYRQIDEQCSLLHALRKCMYNNAIIEFGSFAGNTPIYDDGLYKLQTALWADDLRMAAAIGSTSMPIHQEIGDQVLVAGPTPVLGEGWTETELTAGFINFLIEGGELLGEITAMLTLINMRMTTQFIETDLLLKLQRTAPQHSPNWGVLNDDGTQMIYERGSMTAHPAGNLAGDIMRLNLQNDEEAAAVVYLGQNGIGLVKDIPLSA
jgi:hypothetical protein